MKTIRLLTLLCLFFCAQGFSFDLKYTLRPQVERGLEVVLEFQGNPNGVTDIKLPSSWEGQEELYLEISKLECASAEIENTEKPEIKKIHHLPDEKLQVKYCVTSIERRGMSWYYRPLIGDSYFFFFGQCVFVIPLICIPVEPVFLLEWQDFPPEWNFANSFGAYQTRQELTASARFFQNGVYLGGDFQIFKCGTQAAPIFVATRKEFSFSGQRLAKLVEEVIESQRLFWDDWNFPYYLVSVIPVGDSPYMGGKAALHACALFLGDLVETKVEDERFLKWIVGHEHFHNWNGFAMRPGPPEKSLYWFFEGFTDYYAIKLNYGAGLMTEEEYEEYVKKISEEYVASSVRNVPNKAIEEGFWESYEMLRLPYLRGFLLALRWDRKIQEISCHKQSLDDFMRALLKKTQDAESVYIFQEDIEHVASLFLPPDFVKNDLKKYIENGDDVEP